ncbi:MAG: D-aminoacyl-tRNA deacylase [Candidatus Binatia bacterium]
MRLVVQRVAQASVSVDGEVIAAIKAGVCVFLGIAAGDEEKDADYLVDKVTRLRIFADKAGKMNWSLTEIGGEALVVSEFTLYGDCRQGRRPSFSRASPPAYAEKLYEYFVHKMGSIGVDVKAGRFRSAMHVKLINDGPVTLILDSPS